MLEVFINLASYGYYGDGFREMFSQWEQFGFFSYLLPFLLIFAVVYGVLSKVETFKGNRGVNAVIALAVGLIAVNIEIVPIFFEEIFPRVGIGLAILLVAVIFLEFIISYSDDDMSWMKYVYFGLGAIILITVVSKSTIAVGWSGGYWWEDNWPLVAGAVFILIVVGMIVGKNGKNNSENSKNS